MDKNANIAETYNYDAWGRRRNPETWTYNNVPEPTLIDFGFTSHEHWDKVNIINMTGRLYDPYLARVLNPDPYVSDPNSSQALNRYTYAMNNPMLYFDPNGENVIKSMKKAYRWVRDNAWYPFWDFLNGTPNPETMEYEGGLAQLIPGWVPPVSVGYNTSQGFFHSVNNNEPIYYNQAKVNYAAVAANVEYRARRDAAAYVANYGGVDGLNAGHINYFLGATSCVLAGSQGVKGVSTFLNTLQADFNALGNGISLSKELKLTANIGTGLKWFGRSSGAFSVGFSYYQYTQGQISGGKFALDVAITGASFTPVIGPFIGAQYFIIDNTIGVENIGNMMINQEIQRVKMINNGNWGLIFYPRVGQSVR